MKKGRQPKEKNKPKIKENKKGFRAALHVNEVQQQQQKQNNNNNKSKERKTKQKQKNLSAHGYRYRKSFTCYVQSTFNLYLYL